ncbi:MAG: hypothetical protein V3580_01050 [Candidatus Cardinium sp.]
MTADKAAALESRIKIIRFDEGFTPERKCAIATTYVDELLTKKGIDRSAIPSKCNRCHCSRRYPYRFERGTCFA